MITSRDVDGDLDPGVKLNSITFYGLNGVDPKSAMITFRPGNVRHIEQLQWDTTNRVRALYILDKLSSMRFNTCD